MATNLTTTTFANTYKDDFRDSDNYHRILFNSGRALQARELTQLQTIIQSEIGRFARNIFNEGAVVNPGGITVNNNYEYIKLDETTNSLADNLPVLGEEWYVSPGSTIKFRILRIVEADAITGDPATLYVQYTKTNGVASSSNPIRVSAGSQITTSGGATLDVLGSAATGVGTLASVAKGEYFTQDHFVFAAQQSFLLSKYSGTPTADIGFKVTEDIVTTDDTSALYDNQGAVPNTASPGADRYRITLTLTSRDEVDSDENFVFVARVVDGKVSVISNGTNEYNKINELLALRTKEESGNYVVKPFNTSIENLNDSNLTITVEPGVAYVDGYRLETPLSKLTIPKAQDIVTDSGGNTIAQYGNYVIQDSDGSNIGLPDINTFAVVNLQDAINYGGSTIGTARVRGVERYGSTIRHYLLDIQMNSGSSFTSVKSFGTGVSDYVNVKLEDGIASLKETGNNSLLFPLPNKTPSDIIVNDLTVRTRIDLSGTGVDQTIPAANYSGEAMVWSNTGDWIISTSDSSVNGAADVTFSFDSGPQNIRISGMLNTVDYELIAYQTISGTPTASNKTLQTRNLTKAWPADFDSDGNGLKWITLDRADIYDVSTIALDSANGTDLSGSFTIDNGQRDNFYARGRVIKKAGINLPTGSVYVGFRHFSYSNGHFFDVTSYPVNYDQIPSHRKNNGEIVSLRDVLDFRSVVGADGTFTGTGAKVLRLPENTDAINLNVDYYQPRKDRLVVKRVNSERNTNRGEIAYIQGNSSLTPLEPSIPEGSMELYKYSLNAYTLNDSDLSVTKVDNKGYTMRDISKIEKRIDNLEEITTLNLLEANTANILVVDSNGNPRTKSGFLADNFKTLDFAELSPRYRATIDQADNTLNPLVFRKNVRLVYDSDETRDTHSNIKRSGDLITLDYSHTTLVNQNLATETMNINPFAVITSTGAMELSPSSDEWVEIQYAANRVIDGGTVSNVGAGQLRQALQNGWTGSAGQSIITGSRVVSTIVNETVVDVQVIPWMRSRRVSFRVYGLRPLTRYFPYFNNTAVDNWVKSTASFTRFGTTTTDDGNRYANATAHPDGSSTLTTDAAGTVTGEFFIPSTSSVRFRTGVGEFKLLDVSGGNDDNAVSKARATFTSSGVLETRQRTVRSTRVVNVGTVRNDEGGGGGHDPLAQTFLVDRIEYPNGMFLSKVDVYFATKDDTIPVLCEIVAVENGVPTTQVLPGGVKSLLPTQVTATALPGSPDPTFITTLRGAATSFEFDEPVYLMPGREYAFVVRAESVNYNVYVAKTYDYVVGTTEQRVNRQPTLGSLFQSQNASTWTPDQTRDMMFKLYRADFVTSGHVYLENGAPPLQLLETNPLRVDSGDSDVTFSFQGHGFMYGDQVRVILPTTFADKLGGIDDSAIGLTLADDSEGSSLGYRTITGVDWTGFKVGAITNGGSQTANTTLIGGGSNIVVEQQAVFDEFYPVVQSLVPEQTTITATAAFTSAASYGGSSNSYGRNSGLTSGTRAKGSFGAITLNDVNLNTSPKVIMTSTNETKYLSSEKSATVKLNLTTTDTKVSPVIDLERVSLILTENVIDNQDSASSVNAPLNYVAETDPTDGTVAAKHITKQVTLQETAVGLKILLGANRPSEASIEVYYKTGTSEDVLDDIAWTQVSAEVNLPADNDRVTFREYEYLAGGIGGTLPAFTTYQVKVVMKSTNSSRPPKIRDLRVIALAI